MEFVIPEELVVNIVVRLPINDIFRFKLVCKSWLRLISSPGPYFTINYEINSPYTLIFRVQNNFGNPNVLSYSLIEFSGKGGGENTHQQHHIPITPPEIPDCSNISSFLCYFGSCQGSAFILHRKRLADDHTLHRVYSFNPVSGSCVFVLEDIIRISEPRKYKVGFIPSNNTCKLVRFVPGYEKAEKAEIFTVGGLDDENWRKVDDNDPLLFYGAYGRLICFNGAYHWVSSSDHDRIFTFNLLEEKSGTRIPKPHGMSQRLSNYNTRLTILKDRLSVVEQSEDEHNSASMVIWTMREYDVVESWSKVAVLTFCHTDIEKWRNDDLVPIAVFENGDILFSHKGWEGGMCLYNLQEKRLTPINDHPGSSYRIQENTYIPKFCT